MEIQELNKIILKLCRDNNIRIKRKRSTTASGLAYIEDKVIKIPRITSIQNFCVALHEIAHIVNGDISPPYKEEYMAEKWAIDYAFRLGIDCSDYIKTAVHYVLKTLAEAHNKGELKRVPKQIREFVCEDPKTWIGHKIKIIDRGYGLDPMIIKEKVIKIN